MIDTVEIRRILESYPLCRKAWATRDGEKFRAGCAVTTLLVDAGLSIDFIKRTCQNNSEILNSLANIVLPRVYKIPQEKIMEIIQYFDGICGGPGPVFTEISVSINRVIKLLESYNKSEETKAIETKASQQAFLLTNKPEETTAIDLSVFQQSVTMIDYASSASNFSNVDLSGFLKGGLKNG